MRARMPVNTHAAHRVFYDTNNILFRSIARGSDIPVVMMI
jgi:hypothetical protein